MQFKITYNNGLHSPVMVDAETPDAAKRMGLAIYRQDTTAMDNFTADFVVNTIEAVDIQAKA